MDLGSNGMDRILLKPSYPREIANNIHESCDRHEFVDCDGCSIRLWNVDGVPQFPLKYTLENIQALKSTSFKARRDDIWLVSYPRSG